MEIASIKRFAFIKHAEQLDNHNKGMLFFTPAEELHGANIFAKLSSNYAVIQPYIDMIDGEFITLMNTNSNNIAMFANPNYVFINDQRVNLDKGQGDQKSSIQKFYSVDNTELFLKNSGDVHMYQDDISGNNAIDYAFKKKAFYCIKAFVETLLILTNENN